MRKKDATAYNIQVRHWEIRVDFVLGRSQVPKTPLNQNYVRGVRQIDLSARQNLKSRTGGTSVVIVLYLCNARSATYSY